MRVIARPDGCCEGPPPAAPLPRRKRERLVAALRALGDPARLEMFRLIAGAGAPVCACDVNARFPLRQPTVSHHLRVLREAGLLTATRRGVWAYYEVREPGFRDLLASVGALLRP